MHFHMPCFTMAYNYITCSLDFLSERKTCVNVESAQAEQTRPYIKGALGQRAGIVERVLAASCAKDSDVCPW